MHEMSIAVALLDQVLEVAERHRATRIVQVDVIVGALRHVIPDAMHSAFRAASQGTVAEEATLNLSFDPAGARCRACNGRYQPEGFDFGCPHCGAADAHIVSGNDIVLQSIECDAAVAGGAP